jgi:hypothetical protein
VGGNLSAALDALTLAGTSQVLPLRYGVPLFEFSTQPWARSFVTAPWARYGLSFALTRSAFTTPPWQRQHSTPEWTRAYT